MHTILSVVLLYYLFNRQQVRLRLHEVLGVEVGFR